MIGSRLHGAQALDDIEAAQVRQLQVSEHHVAVLFSRQGQPFLAGGRGDDGMAFVFEHLPKRFRGPRIILDNQNCSGATHVSPEPPY